MDTSYLFALATPLLLCCMGAICVRVWNYHRSHPYLLWQAANLMLVAIAVAAQILLQAHSPYISSLWITGLYLASGICFAQSLAVRFQQPLPWRSISAVVVLTFVAMWFYLWVQPSIPGRITAISLGMGALVSMCIPRLVRAYKPHPLDKFSLALLVLSTLMALLRPLLLLHDPAADATAPAQPPSHNLVWWYAIFTWLLLYVPYSTVLCCSALLDTVHTLRTERDHDVLTGLLNRRAFQERCSQAPYVQGVRILAVCDLDYFKGINDRYGHLVGDDVLRQFAHVMRSNIRESDVIARLGGEEFALALWDIELPHAVNLAQRIANAMPYTIWSSRSGAPITMTASFGIIEVMPWESLEEALQRADVQLYAAKEAGRNCIRASANFAPQA